MNNKELPQTNMPYPMTYQDNDEIDLVELFRTLWKQKAKIALVTAATTLAAGIYAFTAEEVWTSKTVVDQPQLEEVNAYYSVTQQLKRILQKPTIGEIALEPEKITQEVFNEFKKQIESGDLRKEFWLNSDYYAEKIKNKTSNINTSKVLNKLIDDDIQVQRADGKKIMYDTITLSADTAFNAKRLLEQYLYKVNMTIWENKIIELDTALNEETAMLVHEKELIKFTTKTYRDNNVKASENARNIAEKANIKSFDINAMQGNANVDKIDMLFFLGTKALDAQIDNLNNKPLILPVRYYQIERILSELKTLPSLKNLNVKSYRYLMSPNEPIKREQPKRVLIVFGGLILGLVLGGVGVLIMNALSVRNNKG